MKIIDDRVKYKIPNFTNLNSGEFFTNFQSNDLYMKISESGNNCFNCTKSWLECCSAAMPVHPVNVELHITGDRY